MSFFDFCGMMINDALFCSCQRSPPDVERVTVWSCQVFPLLEKLHPVWKPLQSHWLVMEPCKGIPGGQGLVVAWTWENSRSAGGQEEWKTSASWSPSYHWTRNTSGVEGCVCPWKRTSSGDLYKSLAHQNLRCNTKLTSLHCLFKSHGGSSTFKHAWETANASKEAIYVGNAFMRYYTHSI